MEEENADPRVLILNLQKCYATTISDIQSTPFQIAISTQNTLNKLARPVGTKPTPPHSADAGQQLQGKCFAGGGLGTT